MYKEKVFICGGGHQGLSMAAHLSLHNTEVSLWNRTKSHIQKIIDTGIINCSGVVNGVADVSRVSDNLESVFSDLIMVTTPSSAHKNIARLLAPLVSKNSVIILNPGRTFGAIEFAETLIDCGVKELPHIAETQTIVYTCRKIDDNSVKIYALKKYVQIASIRSDDMAFIISKLPACIRNNFLPVSSTALTSFSNVGMILHCAPVLMNIGWIETEKADFKYYYDGISKSVAGILEKMDSERRLVAKSMGFEIESVQEWLMRTYQVGGDCLFECIRNNESYREIDAPKSIYCRYICEDVPNGLVPIEALGNSLGIKTPNITLIIDLASTVMNYDFRKNGRCFNLNILNKYF